jgi:prepilin-type N-terminal cleavage/methylation domain-containing protein
MKKGFTLIELLVVIAVLAILSVAVVVVLNPAELIKQGRDATRMSDLAGINSALSLFSSDQPSATWTATTTCTNGTVGLATTTTTTCTTVTSTAVTGSGWVNVNLAAISSGAPLSRLPTDPVNDNTSTNCSSSVKVGCFYVYKASGTSGKYKLYANMESTKYQTGGGSDVESDTKDGGLINDWYELGSDMTL